MRGRTSGRRLECRLFQSASWTIVSDHGLATFTGLDAFRYQPLSTNEGVTI
jgi:hypothetical protein